MKYKEFVDWCNQRACDGCWSAGTAMYCIGICSTIDSYRFWKREKIWKEKYEEEVVRDVVEVINEKRREMGYC